MAIAFDAATAGTYNLASYAHTVGSGAHRLLLVATVANVGNGDASGVTYNGQALSAVSSAAFSYNAYGIKLWYLLSPPSGSNTVAIAGVTSDFTSHALSYSGVSQVGFPDAVATSTGSGSPYSKSLDTVANNCWMVFLTMNGTGNASASTGSTLRAAGTTLFLDAFDSNGPLQVGTNAMTVTRAGSPVFGSALVSFAPASVPGLLPVL